MSFLLARDKKQFKRHICYSLVNVSARATSILSTWTVDKPRNGHIYIHHGNRSLLSYVRTAYKCASNGSTDDAPESKIL